MAYNYDDQIPTWENQGTEPADSIKLEGFKAGYKPPASYFNWFWSSVMRWVSDLRSKVSSLHTQIGTVENKVKSLEDKDYTVSASDVLSKLKTVDGTGSGLDADTLDGKDSSDFADVNHKHAEYAATNHNHANATANSNGFMSAEDKAKLDDIDLDDLGSYTHPSTHPASMITGLSDVAKSGNYADLINKPVLSAVATSNDYNDLNNKPAVYTHPSTHPASMIEETANIKMMTAAERTKLANINEKANFYEHPSTHPASMITGLSEYINNLGYNKIIHGSYVGNGSSYLNTTFPFNPSLVILYGPIGGYNFKYKFITLTQGEVKKIDYSNNGVTCNVAYLNGNCLSAYHEQASVTANKAGSTYIWVAYA